MALRIAHLKMRWKLEISASPTPHYQVKIASSSSTSRRERLYQMPPRKRTLVHSFKPMPYNPNTADATIPMKQSPLVDDQLLLPSAARLHKAETEKQHHYIHDHDRNQYHDDEEADYDQAFKASFSEEYNDYHSEQCVPGAKIKFLDPRTAFEPQSLSSLGSFFSRISPCFDQLQDATYEKPRLTHGKSDRDTKDKQLHSKIHDHGARRVPPAELVSASKRARRWIASSDLQDGGFSVAKFTVPPIWTQRDTGNTSICDVFDLDSEPEHTNANNEEQKEQHSPGDEETNAIVHYQKHQHHDQYEDNQYCSSLFHQKSNQCSPDLRDDDKMENVPHGVFEGNISLVKGFKMKNAGYAAVTWRGHIDLEGFNAFELIVKSKYKRDYYFTMTTECLINNWALYQVAIGIPDDGEFHKIIIPFKKFYKTRDGHILMTQTAPRIHNVFAIGLSLNDKREGPFHLEIESISALLINSSSYD